MKKISFKRQLFSVMAILVASSIIIFGAIGSFALNNAARQQNTEKLNENFSVCVDKFNKILLSTNMVAAYLSSDAEFSEILFSPSSDNMIRQVNDIAALEKKIENMYQLAFANLEYDDISACFFAHEDLPISKNLYYNTTGTLLESRVRFCLDSEVKNEEWYKNTMSRDGGLYFFKEESFDRIYIAKKIRRALNFEQSLGVIVLGVDLSSFLTEISAAEFKTPVQLFLVDDNKNVIWENGDAFLEESAKKSIIQSGYIDGSEIRDVFGKNLFIKNNFFRTSGLEMVAISQQPSVSLKLDEAWQIIGIIVVVSILLFFIANKLSEIINKPINNLVTGLNNLETEDDVLKIADQPCKVEELERLYNAFVHMHKKLQHFAEENRSFGIQEKEIELNILQNQINRHYIYNALDTIACAALLEGNDEIAELITALSNNMRYSINIADNFVTFEKECEFLFDYIQLQKRRYDGVIDLKFKIPDTLETYKIPKFVIQPLIENSIIHAKPLPDTSLVITVTAELREDDVLVTVIDNGRSSDVDKINGIASGLIKPDVGGHGIRNVNERLSKCFGKQYTLVYSQDENGDLIASVNIPKMI